MYRYYSFYVIHFTEGLPNKEQTSFFFLWSFTVPKDPNPQWRKVAWSHDCTLLAYTDSTGTVRLFDLMGSELFVIPPVMTHINLKTILLLCCCVLGIYSTKNVGDVCQAGEK